MGGGVGAMLYAVLHPVFVIDERKLTRRELRMALNDLHDGNRVGQEGLRDGSLNPNHTFPNLESLQFPHLVTR